MSGLLGLANFASNFVKARQQRKASDRQSELEKRRMNLEEDRMAMQKSRDQRESMKAAFQDAMFRMDLGQSVSFDQGSPLSLPAPENYEGDTQALRTMGYITPENNMRFELYGADNKPIYGIEKPMDMIRSAMARAGYAQPKGGKMTDQDKRWMVGGAVDKIVDAMQSSYYLEDQDKARIGKIAAAHPDITPEQFVQTYGSDFKTWTDELSEIDEEIESLDKIISLRKNDLKDKYGLEDSEVTSVRKEWLSQRKELNARRRELGRNMERYGAYSASGEGGMSGDFDPQISQEVGPKISGEFVSIAGNDEGQELEARERAVQSSQSTPGGDRPVAKDVSTRTTSKARMQVIEQSDGTYILRDPNTGMKQHAGSMQELQKLFQQYSPGELR